MTNFQDSFRKTTGKNVTINWPDSWCTVHQPVKAVRGTTKPMDPTRLMSCNKQDKTLRNRCLQNPVLNFSFDSKISTLIMYNKKTCISCIQALYSFPKTIFTDFTRLMQDLKVQFSGLQKSCKSRIISVTCQNTRGCRFSSYFQGSSLPTHKTISDF